MEQRTTAVVAALVLCAACPTPAAAQFRPYPTTVIHYRGHGAVTHRYTMAYGAIANTGHFAYSGALLNDLNGNGSRDVVLSRIERDRVRIFDPLSGEIVTEVLAPTAQIGQTAFFGQRVAPCGDLDLDGAPDFLVEARLSDSTDAVVAMGGAPPHSLIWWTNQKLSEAFPIGDINDDGISDVAGRVGVGIAALSGADGSDIWFADEFAGLPLVLEDTTHSALVDFNGDGAVEIGVRVVGTTARAVAVIDGRTGNMLQLLEQPYPEFFNDSDFGQSVTSVPDADGDGIDDIAVASPQLYTSQGNVSTGGAVLIYSPTDGSLLPQRFFSPYSLRLSGGFGQNIQRISDINGDGVDDLVVNDTEGLGTPHDLTNNRVVPNLTFYSGATQRPLDAVVAQRFDGDLNGFGATLLLDVGDLDGDGRTEVLTSVPQWDAAMSPFPGQDTIELQLFVFSPASKCFADRTGDGMVDAADLAELLAQWGPDDGLWPSNEERRPFNFNYSNSVDGGDLSFLLARWGPCR